MNQPNGTRTCEVQNRGRKGQITEKLVEFVPEKRTDSTRKVTAETYYTPANWAARVMNKVMMKQMFAGAQKEILKQYPDNQRKSIIYMTTLHNEVTIDAPIDNIWASLSNIEELEKYDPTVKKSIALTPVKSGIGATEKWR